MRLYVIPFALDPPCLTFCLELSHFAGLILYPTDVRSLIPPMAMETRIGKSPCLSPLLFR